MAKLVKLDPAFQVVLPAAANGGWVDLKWDASWRVAALLAGGPDRGKIELVIPLAQIGRFAALDSTGSPSKPLLVAAPVLADVLPGVGLPYLTITVTPTYPVGVPDPGRTIVYRGRPHETSDGVWDLTDIGSDGSGPVLVTQAQRQSVDAALTSLTGKLSQADADHVLSVQALAESARLQAQLKALPIGIRGLRVENPVAAYGGTLWDFVPDSTVTLSATYAVAPFGGLLYDLTGGE